MIDVGKNIKKIRVKKGLTQYELGKRLGVSSVTISMYEQNKKIHDEETIEKIAKALGVSQCDICSKEIEIKLDTNLITNILHSYESIAKTPLDKATIMALKELLEYRETGLTPDQVDQMSEEISYLRDSYNDMTESYNEMLYDM